MEVDAGAWSLSLEMCWAERTGGETSEMPVMERKSRPGGNRSYSTSSSNENSSGGRKERLE